MSAPGDWEVVEEALNAAEDFRMDLRNENSIALREIAPEAFAALARLREREAELIADQSALHDVTEAAGVMVERRRAEAAEARVAEVERERGERGEGEQFWANKHVAHIRKIARLEEALREIVALEDNATEHFNDLGMADVARRALAHEEETP